MKRLIYMILTLVATLSIGGCSSAITVKDLSMIEEAEGLEPETKNLFTPQQSLKHTNAGTFESN